MSGNGEVNILLLAAGSSSRMGQSKQLLPVGEETLISKTINTALSSNADNVFVVLGSNEAAHRTAIQYLPVTIISNPDWAMGVGSSLKAGLRNMISTSPKTEAVIILVCDQPYLNAGHIQKIIECYRSSNTSIVASGYSDALGVPALFSERHFGELLGIGDQEGAKKIIHKHIEYAKVVLFPEGAIDLDTPGDLENFIKSKDGFT